jgi:hypothetical protein
MTATGETRTRAKMGTRSVTQWPADLLVEYGPATEGLTLFGITGERFAVYVNGEKIGTVESRAKEQTRKISRGIIASDGIRIRWDYNPVPSRRNPLRSAPSRTSRVEATAALIADCLRDH